MNPLYVFIVREDRAAATANDRIQLAADHCYRCWQPVEPIAGDQVTTEASNRWVDFAGQATKKVVS